MAALLLLLDLSQWIPQYQWCPVNGFSKRERPWHQSATRKVMYILKGPRARNKLRSVLSHSLMQLQWRRWKMVLTQEPIYYSTVHSRVVSLPHLSQEDKVFHSPFSLLLEHRYFQIGRRLTKHQSMYVFVQREIADPQVVLLHNIGSSMGTKGNRPRYDLAFYKVSRWHFP